METMGKGFAWKRWKLGFFVAIFSSLLVAGAGLFEGITWRQFVAVFCAAAVTNFAAFLAKHPVESVEFDAEQQEKEHEEVTS